LSIEENLEKLQIKQRTSSVVLQVKFEIVSVTVTQAVTFGLFVYVHCLFILSVYHDKIVN